jgi:hypothetical protein
MNLDHPCRLIMKEAALATKLNPEDLAKLGPSATLFYRFWVYLINSVTLKNISFMMHLLIGLHQFQSYEDLYELWEWSWMLLLQGPYFKATTQNCKNIQCMLKHVQQKKLQMVYQHPCSNISIETNVKNCLRYYVKISFN